MQLVAVCLRHALGVSGPRVSASDVQAELLSTYAVDLMPLERVSGSLRVGGATGSPTRRTSWSCSSSLLFQVIGFVINAVMTLILVAWVLAIVLGVVELIARAFS